MTVSTVATEIAKKSREVQEIVQAIPYYFFKNPDDLKKLPKISQDLLKSKVATQRYLATKFPSILCHMDESHLRAIFYDYGGLMSDVECQEFEKAPYYDQKVRLFHIIQQAEKKAHY